MSAAQDLSIHPSIAAHSLYSANSQLEGNKCVVIEIRTDYASSVLWSSNTMLSSISELLLQLKMFVYLCVRRHFNFDLASERVRAVLQNVSVINCCFGIKFCKERLLAMPQVHFGG